VRYLPDLADYPDRHALRLRALLPGADPWLFGSLPPPPGAPLDRHWARMVHRIMRAEARYLRRQGHDIPEPEPLPVPPLPVVPVGRRGFLPWARPRVRRGRAPSTHCRSWVGTWPYCPLASLKDKHPLRKGRRAKAPRKVTGAFIEGDPHHPSGGKGQAIP
jgi:hypothetical protein